MILVHWLVILSAVISISGDAVYIFDTLKGKTKPNRVSWFLWAMVPMIATGAALYSGADIWATSRIFVAGLIPVVVFIFSFTIKQSFWKVTKFDLMCGLFSVLAIVVWLLANSPVMAVLFAIVADGFAVIPTLVKAWKFPETETGWTFLAGFIGTLIILPSIPKWNIQNSAFQIYLLIANALLVLFIFRTKLIKKLF